MYIIKRVSWDFLTFTCLINAHHCTIKDSNDEIRRYASIKVLILELGHLFITYNRIKANGFSLNRL